MSSTREALLETSTDADRAYDIHFDELLPLQVQAAHEVFEQRVARIPLVRKRADDAGIAAIREPRDLVPLLFAHIVYKSYLQSFADQCRWDRMLQWLQTLSVADVGNVDLHGAADADDFLDRLWAAGHGVLATSGSGGKCSFLNHTPGDRELKSRHFKYTTGWPFARSAPDRPLFWLEPIEGFNSAVEAAQINRVNWGRPAATHSLRSPLGSGILSGKHGAAGDGARLNKVSLRSIDDRSLAVARGVGAMAAELGREPARVAIHWIRARPGVVPLLGARTDAQLKNSLACLDFDFDPSTVERLDALSAIEIGYPHETTCAEPGRSRTLDSTG
jgi:Aldo/keto reductase family